MRYRKLRIAWSVAWGAVAVLLVVLWVRSYWWRDQPQGKLFAWWYVIGSRSDQVYASLGDRGNPPAPAAINHWRMTEAYKPPSFLKTRLGFAKHYQPGGGRYVQCPHWLVVSLIAVLTILPWLQYRFSLRTLLHATTLVAAGLGFVKRLA